ncbi:MAG: hypothetical protein J5809_03410 [Selenomonadaceae bacterium]|nr:hypothetical protein [Selenomonadaceae bacterium]
MNDDLRRIFEMVAAINTRLEVNERSIKQIDHQLALLNLKREAELNDFREAMKNLTAAVDELKQLNATAADNTALTKAVDELKVATRNTVKADDFVTVRMALQNSAVSLNDVKKRVDGIKFDTNKKFNELAVNSDINQQAIMNALAEIKNELAKPEVPAEKKPEHDFKTADWWSGDKER